MSEAQGEIGVEGKDFRVISILISSRLLFSSLPILCACKGRRALLHSLGGYVPSFPFPFPKGEGLTGEGIGKSMHGREQNLDVICPLQLCVDQAKAGTLPEVTHWAVVG